MTDALSKPGQYRLEVGTGVIKNYEKIVIGILDFDMLFRHIDVKYVTRNVIHNFKSHFNDFSIIIEAAYNIKEPVAKHICGSKQFLEKLIRATTNIKNIDDIDLNKKICGLLPHYIDFDYNSNFHSMIHKKDIIIVGSIEGVEFIKNSGCE